MTNTISMKFQTEIDTPSEVQAAARALVIGGLAMVRDQMIADGNTEGEDWQLVTAMLAE